MEENTAVLPPIPRASVRTTVVVKPGARTSDRIAYRTVRRNPSTNIAMAANG